MAPGHLLALPAQWEAGFSVGKGQADVEAGGTRPPPCVVLRGWQGGAGSPVECPATEEDLLHEGPWASRATYQAWLVTARKLTGWGTKGLRDQGALGRLPVPLTISQLSWEIGTCIQDLGSMALRGFQPSMWEPDTQARRQQTDRTQC